MSISMCSLKDFILFQGAYHPEERWPFPSFPKLPWQHCRQTHRPSAMWSFGKAPAIAAMPSKTMSLKQQHHGIMAPRGLLAIGCTSHMRQWQNLGRPHFQMSRHRHRFVVACHHTARSFHSLPSICCSYRLCSWLLVTSLTDTHTYTFGSVPNEASLLWLPARRLKVTGSSVSPSCKGFKIRLYGRIAAVAAMQVLGKKHLIQLVLSCCCGKSRFLLHVF